MPTFSKASRVFLIRRRREITAAVTVSVVLVFIYLQSITSHNLDVKPLSDAERLTRLAQTCGSLCDSEVNNTAVSPSGHIYRHIPMPLSRCRTLYSNPYVHWSHGGVPPRTIPSWMRSAFTLNGRVTVTYQYKKNVYLGNQKRTMRWTREMIAGYSEQLRNGTLRGTYGADKTSELARLLQNLQISGHRVLVLGSEKPWVEVAALAAGARQTVTLEYGALVTEDERMEAYTPSAFGKKYLDGMMDPFDTIIAYSSIEHSGLGRYGDALNPWGDVLAIAMAWCVARPRAKLVLMVPRSRATDSITFNLHRIYGPQRLPFLATNWARIHRDSENPWNLRVPLYRVHARSIVFEKMDA